MTARERALSGRVIESSCGSSRCSRQHSTAALPASVARPRPQQSGWRTPADLDRIGRLGPVMVSDEANPPDQPAALEVLGRPEAEALVAPTEHEAKDQVPSPLEVERTHMDDVPGVGVDLR